MARPRVLPELALMRRVGRRARRRAAEPRERSIGKRPRPTVPKTFSPLLPCLVAADAQRPETDASIAKALRSYDEVIKSSEDDGVTGLVRLLDDQAGDDLRGALSRSLDEVVSPLQAAVEALGQRLDRLSIR
jgi:hypothetical protein